MKVINVGLYDDISNIQDNVIVFNKETLTYFRKDPSVEFESPLMFKDAVQNEFSDYSRTLEIDTSSNYKKYSDTNDKFKIENSIGELEKLQNMEYERFKSLEINPFPQDVSDEIKEEFYSNRVELTDDFKNGFNKIIYVDIDNGDDTNDGSETQPLKSLRLAEKNSIDGTLIIINKGNYDITFGNTNSTKNYCQSGLMGKENCSITYFGVDDPNLIIDTRDISYDSRDISFVNGLKEGSKIYNLNFKLFDASRVNPWSVSLVRNSPNVELNGCTFELDSKAMNFVMNKLSDESTIFTNCLVYSHNDLNTKPYLGTYQTENLFYNSKLDKKLKELDPLNTNFKNEITMVSGVGLKLF